MDSSTWTVWSSPFPVLGVSDQFVLLQCFIGIPVIDSNSVDPDQTPRSAASDLGIHCLQMSHLWDARHKWVNLYVFLFIYFCDVSLIVLGSINESQRIIFTAFKPRVKIMCSMTCKMLQYSMFLHFFSIFVYSYFFLYICIQSLYILLHIWFQFLFISVYLIICNQYLFITVTDVFASILEIFVLNNGGLYSIFSYFIQPLSITIL